MASYHCTVKIGGKGRAAKHADYIEREGQYAQTPGKESKLEDLEHKASGNMPKWAEHEAGIFWRAADEHERANGATYREIEIALPRELNPEQRRALVEDFIKQEIGDRHAYTYAIHIPKAALEKGDQPHCHFMYSERTLDGIDRDPEQYFKRANSKNPEKGGCKKDSAGTKERLLATRELWAKVQNHHLEKAGFSERVSHLSLKAQGIDRQPEKHLGPIDSKKIDAPALLESRAAEAELELARKELSKIDIPAALAAEQARVAAVKAAEQAAQAQAQREAVAASQARAAAEQAADRLTAAAEAKEKDDRIRKSALAALARSSAATDRACAFAVADHAGIADNLRAASGDLGRAVKGAQRRVAERHYGRVVEAARSQFERVGRVVQQVADRIERVVRSVAAAAHQVAQQVAARLERQRAAARPVDTRSAKEIWAASPENPLNIAKREAREAAAAAAKPAPRVMMPDGSKIERRPVEQVKPVAPPSPPKPTEQEAKAKLLEVSIGMRAQWDAALVAERALYLKELTQQAYDKTVAHVAEHQAHIDAKPRIFGRDKWEAQRQSFENRDTANNRNRPTNTILARE